MIDDFMNSSVTTASTLSKEIAKATENSLLEQLNDFISRGLIEYETTGPTFIREERFPFTSPPSYIIKVSQSCRLVLKDKEYILKLEKENKKMKELLEKLGKFSETQKT